MVHISLGGSRVRVVLSNEFGDAPLDVGAARDFDLPMVGKLKTRVSVLNLFDRSYLTYYSQANYSGTDDDYYAGRGRTVTLSWRRSF